jgi:hypothetical protein
MSNLQAAIEEAEIAFWDVIVKRFPQAQTGDLSPLATFQLSQAQEQAVKEWIDNNVKTQEDDVKPGYRFKLFNEVDRFPDFKAPASLTGTLTIVSDDGVWAKMDGQVAGAEHWDNQIHWETPQAFAMDTQPKSISTYLSATTTYTHEADGHTYWLDKKDQLWAAPTFIDGKADHENESLVDDFDDPLSPEERQRIRAILESKSREAA